MSAFLAGVILTSLIAAVGCDLSRERVPRIPSEEEARVFFEQHSAFVAVTVRGNVVEAKFRQPFDQLRRGGSLWARVGPYVYLFAPPTRDLFNEYPDVAALRVVTVIYSGEEVARAMLLRDEFRELQWRRTQYLLARALRDGTERPSVIQDLVRWGETHTEYEYNTRYVRR